VTRDCLFCKIIKGEIPTRTVYEDERTFVFEDINPQAPTHVLIVPKKHIAGLPEAGAEDTEILGHCQLVAAKIAQLRGVEEGYRTVYNVGPDAGQSVFHLHLHLLGGRKLAWPPG
jgi:histidine triad (HIT) family protein